MNNNVELKNEVLSTDIWRKAFDIVEQSFTAYPVKNSFVSLLEKVNDIVKTNDIQVFIYDEDTKKYELFKTLNTSNQSLVNECNRFNEGETFKNILFLNFKSEMHSFIVAINNLISISAEYKRILNRIFTLMFFKYDTEKILNNLYLTDKITGIKNRTAYDDESKRFFESVPNKVTFAIFDLFRLKAINDNYGHKYGDLYISKAAKLIKEQLTKEEQKGFYRIGGDEFVFFIKGSQRKNFEKKIWKANQVLFKDNIGLKLKFPLLINYGIVEGKGNFDSLYRRADKALSINKRDTYLNLHIERRK